MTISQLLPKVAGVLAVAAVSVTAGSAMATTITFDDLPTAPDGLQVANGYNGFNWDNFRALDGVNYTNGTIDALPPTALRYGREIPGSQTLN